jgi:hypothetical protein
LVAGRLGPVPGVATRRCVGPGSMFDRRAGPAGTRGPGSTGLGHRSAHRATSAAVHLGGARRRGGGGLVHAAMLPG